ncbi:MAG: hypothetical protein LQ350_003391 [Teloschistes chrysophthalmus]|nr:MAG: hypothetical protein LQ350_003391 [Niorma chrysophthalma]
MARFLAFYVLGRAQGATLAFSISPIPYTTNIPSANAIPRFSNLDAGEFKSNWADKPFIATEPVRQWPCFQKWSTDALLKKYGDTVFRAEAVDWPLRIYMEYMSNNEDESPLYLFDCSFVEKMDLKVRSDGDYWPPECFGEDLFDVLGEQRPDRRWLILGGAGSGSSYHKDPNATRRVFPADRYGQNWTNKLTSAWNAVLRGSKYWVMFPSGPSHSAPPGVYVSEDQSEVTSPLSIAEWLLNFHAEARKSPGCVEGICNEGEVLHVPSGWWHLVVNLSPSIAVTQNFVPEAHLANALGFLRDKPEQVSGFGNDVKDPYSLFTARLGDTHPALLEGGLAELERLQPGKKRKWDELVEMNGENGAKSKDFCFGFGDDDDAEVP